MLDYIFFMTELTDSRSIRIFVDIDSDSDCANHEYWDYCDRLLVQTHWCIESPPSNLKKDGKLKILKEVLLCYLPCVVANAENGLLNNPPMTINSLFTEPKDVILRILTSLFSNVA